MKDNNLDQFYTNPLISDELISIFFELFPSKKKSYFFEPSAGSGNFINSLVKNGIKKSKIIGYDIEPKSKEIKFGDYLNLDFKFSKNKVIVGNPPFGKRGKLALDFLNKSLKEASVVAMILPNIFNRYSIQKKIESNAKLIYSKTLQENAFILNDKEYAVKCVFQIWSQEINFVTNKRILEALPIRHEDFKTWIYNNTKSTFKYFNKEEYKWDFAVHRQGYYNYNEKIYDEKKLKKNRQYFFIKAKNKKILKIIEKIDFEKLSKSNTQVFGFSTTDFVLEYKKMKNEKEEKC